MCQECDETDDVFEARIRSDDPVMSDLWDDVFAMCAAEQRAEAKGVTIGTLLSPISSVTPEKERAMLVFKNAFTNAIEREITATDPIGAKVDLETIETACRQGFGYSVSAGLRTIMRAYPHPDCFLVPA